MDHLEDGAAWGIVANSGNANACCPLSHENAQAMALPPPSHRPPARGLCGGLHRSYRKTINIGVIQAGISKGSRRFG